MAKNSDDIAETIQQINDGEILDTFNEDNNMPLSHNLHTNHIPKNKLAEDRSDTVSLPGDRGDPSKRKFRQVLGDRELMLKQNKLSTQDLSGSNEKLEKDEEMGSGLFDRFSLARKTLDRNSIRYNKNSFCNRLYRLYDTKMIRICQQIKIIYLIDAKHQKMRATQ